MKVTLYLIAVMVFMMDSGVADNHGQPPASAARATLTEPTVKAEKQVLLLGVGHTNKRRLTLLEESLDKFDIALSSQSAKDLSQNQFMQLMTMYDLILLEGLNLDESKKAFDRYAGVYKNDESTAIISLRDPKGSANSNITKKQARAVAEYYQNGGQENFKNLGVFVASSVFSLTGEQAEAAVPMPDAGYYHPEGSQAEALVSSDSADFFEALGRRDNQPLIAIAFHRADLETDNMEVVNALITRIESLGAKSYGAFDQSIEAETDYFSLLLDPVARPDIVINYRTIHYAEKHKQEFANLNVPVIQAINYQGTADEYHDDHSGISPAMTAFFLVMPETAGAVNPVILSEKSEQGHKSAIPEQLASLAARAVKHARLAHLKNSEKKLAVMVWNYPPGEHNIGAAYLNVPASLTNTINNLRQAGYTVNTADEKFFIEGANMLLRTVYRKEDASHLIEKGYADYFPLSAYEKWFATIPREVQDNINKRWGTPARNKLLTERDGEQYFIIPRIKLGNLIVLPKPSRSDGEDAKASLYHSMTTPVNHYYLAVYLYVTAQYGADAIIHFGTHGSQEWLPGKECGLWAYDPGNLAIDNTPIIYPYIIDNVGEAMQSKRRGSATMISHLTPGFALAGAYRELSELQELLNQRAILDDGSVLEANGRRIIEIVESEGLLGDLGISKKELAADLDVHITQLQDILQDAAGQAQPLGLHTFGNSPPQDHVLTTIVQMLGNDGGEKSFADLAAEYEQEKGWSIPEAERIDENGAIKLVALPGYAMLKRFIIDKPDDAPPDGFAQQITTAGDYWQRFHSLQETPNLLRALDGEFIAPCNGNDPIRNPDAVPTGCNLIGFDPDRVPPQNAYEVGSKLTEQTIANYYQRHGKYPEKLAFSLWSLETMRHHGVLESQILAALGVRPVWNENGRIVGTEVIPFSELGRPRVDVVVSATGLYRDAFPNVMLRIAQAIKDIAELKEASNPVYRNSEAAYQSLLKAGKSEEDARYLSTVRIFSSESGNYGTGLEGAALASDTWEEDSKLADLYTRRMGVAFGADESRWSERVDGVNLYQQALSGTDGVVFSRSTNLYALLTNDDPFQYFGGIALAVRNVDGKTPEMFVSNLRKKGGEKVQTMESFLAAELRARYLHPRWIKEMQNEGYAGATAILDRMNNFWGWEVMAPEYVKDEQWQQLYEVYINDKYEMEMDKFFAESNPAAQAQILERMLEAVRKEYWPADDKTVRHMVERYIEIADRHDVYTNNDTFKEYVDSTAAGFGLAPLTAQPVEAVMPQAESQAAQSTQSTHVEGQMMEKAQQPDDAPIDNSYYYLVALIMLFFAAGFFYQLVSWPLLSRRVEHG